MRPLQLLMDDHVSDDTEVSKDEDINDEDNNLYEKI